MSKQDRDHRRDRLVSAPKLAASHTSVVDFAAAVSAGLDEPTDVVRLDVDGCRIDVATDEPRLRDRLARYFRRWIVSATDTPHLRIVALERPSLELDVAWTIEPDEPGTTRMKQQYLDLPDGRLVLDRRTGMLFAFGGDVHLAIGRCLRNDDQVVDFLNNRYMQWRTSQGYLVAHAAAVGRDGRCLAICGTSGVGKSTTALRLFTEGLDFVSNDRLLLRPSQYGVEMLGVPKYPRVDPGALLFNVALEHMLSPKDRIRLKALPTDELMTLEHKQDVLIDEVRGAGRFATRGHLAALVVFNWDDASGEPMAREVDLSIHRKLLPAITGSPGLFFEPDEEAETLDMSAARYLDVLSRRPVVEISGGRDFDAAAGLAREVLERYAP
ncbi:MAG: HprK-related kinase B [Gemmatimonadota bacterium]